MNKTCVICQEQGKYKCPTCLIFYCSVACCKKHRENECEISKRKNIFQNSEGDDSPPKKRKLESSVSASVDTEKLKFLKTDEEVNKLLTNSHLRNLLITIDEGKNAGEVMQKAMQEPIFVEFADACLKAVDPDLDENT